MNFLYPFKYFYQEYYGLYFILMTFTTIFFFLYVLFETDLLRERPTPRPTGDFQTNYDVDSGHE